MAEEEFNYKGRKVVIQLLQPLTGRWLWRVSIDNAFQPTPKRAPLVYREDALRFAADEAKEIIDGIPPQS
jgi:hypothetical protein